MRKIIKALFTLLLISALIVGAITVANRLGLFREDEPRINEYVWQFVKVDAGSIADNPPNIHGAPELGYGDSELIDMTLRVRDGDVYIAVDGETIAVSDTLVEVTDGKYTYWDATFGDVTVRIHTAVTKYVDWNPEYSGFDGNDYGEYNLSFEIIGENYSLLFFPKR